MDTPIINAFDYGLSTGAANGHNNREALGHALEAARGNDAWTIIIPEGTYPFEPAPVHVTICTSAENSTGTPRPAGNSLFEGEQPDAESNLDARDAEVHDAQ